MFLNQCLGGLPTRTRAPVDAIVIRRGERSAPSDAEISLPGTDWVLGLARSICVRSVGVGAPLPDVAEHVVEAKVVRAETAYRCREGMPSLHDTVGRLDSEGLELFDNLSCNDASAILAISRRRSS